MNKGYWGKTADGRRVHFFFAGQVVTLCGHETKYLAMTAEEEDWDPEDEDTCPRCRNLYKWVKKGLHYIQPEGKLGANIAKPG